MERKLLVELWEAANTHSVVMGGEYLDPDFEGLECPPAPADKEVINEVIKYLKETV